MKPYVQVACFCEKVLRELDNVPTLIRIVDTFQIEPEMPLPPGVTFALPLTLFIALKAGDVKGEHAVGLQLTKPSGAAGPLREWPTMFSGDENGVNLQISFNIPDPEIGLYWVDVLWVDDGEVLTRVPLRVKPKTPSVSTGHEPMPSNLSL
jgi:hypothetical protein